MSYFGGRPITLSFTPAEAGHVEVSCIFDMAWTDFGGSPFNAGAVFCQQNGVSLYGERAGPPPFVRQSFRLVHVFNVSADAEVTVGLAAFAGSVRRLSFWNLSLQADFKPGVLSSAPPAPAPSPPPGPTPPGEPPPPEPPPPPPGEPPAPPP
jgi:hypothetical protein